ncbi:DUF2894 domain-containing protein [Lysobacter sp. A03]|uniref:DUF2894 domain-containing protein n=1 Tax=Lysobacter sp. A03 TaxID=1199154 RepID=UPI0005B6E81C|nr:DUF2894 domain-containing protein [Lysobacter sp. A03]KIQ97728.1 hypothetical protein TI01_0665 [Lysobacter sp. A03]
MPADASRPAARPEPLQDERAQHANRVRDALIAAMQRRLDFADAAVAPLIQARLDELVQSRPAEADATPATHAGSPTTADRSRRALRGLSEYIQANKPAGHPATSTDKESGADSPSTVLEEFRQLWDRIRTDSQLRAALAPIPDDAGPLHSSALLHRALRLMGDTSPGYLQHFIAYADALAWMERLQQAGLFDAAAGNPGAGGSAKPRARKRAKVKQTAVKPPIGKVPGGG